MEETKEYLDCGFVRRFGVEIELNAADGRNRPIGHEEGRLPEGIHYVGNLVQKTTREKVLIHKWGHDHNNDCWVIKPDSSCGLEVCSPVSKGWYGLSRICKVVEAFSLDPRIRADGRCSLHVHVDVSDLDLERVAAIVAWWVKCEPVFMDSVPPQRKRNRYCQFLGLTDIFEHNISYTPDSLIKRVGYTKYSSLNTYHLKNGKRSTIEFRIMESRCCRDPLMMKNWVRLLLHFVQRSVYARMPKPYEEGNCWTGWVWLDPVDVFKFLGFSGECVLSPGMAQVRDWFLQRLLENSKNTGLSGVMSDQGRSISRQQIESLAGSLLNSSELSPSREELIYSDNFRL